MNWQRKTEQTNVGTQLEELNNQLVQELIIIITIYYYYYFSWITLVYRNFEIERECLKVQREIDYLKRKAEERKMSQSEDTESQNE